MLITAAVSENRRRPVNAQMTMTPTAVANAQELPVPAVARRANSRARPIPPPFLLVAMMSADSPRVRDPPVMYCYLYIHGVLL